MEPQPPHQNSVRGKERTRLNSAARRAFKYLAFALVVHLFVLPQIGGARNALSVLGTINPILIALAVALEGGALLAYARLTQRLLPVEHRPTLPVAFGAVMASTAVNHVVPGGAAATAAANYRLLGRAGVPADSLGFAIGMQAIGSAVVLNVLLWLALVVSIPTSGFNPIYATAAGAGAILIAAFSFAIISMRRGRDQFAMRAASAVCRLPRVDEAHVRSTIVGLAGQLDLLFEDRKRLKDVLGLAAANWLLDAAALWVALSAFGSPPGFDGLLVAYGLANVMAALPISPGGLGVVEAILIPTLVGFGTPATQASIGVVAYRLVNFWLPIPVGALSYVLVDRANSQAKRLSFKAEINRRAQASHPK